MSMITEFYNGVYIRLCGSPTKRAVCHEALGRSTMIVFVGFPWYRENEKRSLGIGQDFIGMLLREYVYWMQKRQILRCDITVRRI